MEKPLRLLNNLTPSQFLAEYWQKKPLLIRQAMPSFQGLLTPNELAGLACEEDVQSRIVQKQAGSWTVQHGPFDEAIFSALPSKNWTLLVQSVNHHLLEAADLLSLFAFIPHAQLDDVMVSYATTGGSVGPHVDAYDVFLLQGSGARRWQINVAPDPTLVINSPLAILEHFSTDEEWLLEAGDMLYLPPNVAHYGIAEDDACMTYSIGFRAPKAQEIAQAFLEYLQDTLQLSGQYEDADLKQQLHPAEISDSMIKKVEALLSKVSWDTHLVGDFLGRYLSEPKPDIVFEPIEAISADAFNKLLVAAPIRLHLKSQMLFHQDSFYINGEPLTVPPIVMDDMRVLADKRVLDASGLSKAQRRALTETLHSAFMAGYVTI